MKKLALDDVPMEEGRSAAVTRDIAEMLKTSDMGIQYYELAPGDFLGRTYHMHEDQEEVFITLKGTVTFETESGEVDVKEKEVIRFARGDYQRGRNRSNERTVVLGLGAPKDPSYDNAERLRYCDMCEEMTPQTNTDQANSVITNCDHCGTETGRWS